MVGIQEAIPLWESASALFGSGKPFAGELEQREIGHLARRISFPAHSTMFTESEPSTSVYMLTHGTAGLSKMLADGRRSKLWASLCQVTFSGHLSSTDIHVRSMRSAKSQRVSS